MPTPRTKVQIAIKVTSGEASDYVTIHNETQGWKIRSKLNSSGETMYNTSESADTPGATGDKINVYANGRIYGSGSKTVVSGGVKISFAGTTNTISQVVNL